MFFFIILILTASSKMNKSAILKIPENPIMCVNKKQQIHVSDMHLIKSQQTHFGYLYTQIIKFNHKHAL